MKIPARDPKWIEELRREIEAKHQELEGSPAKPGLVPLKIACAMSSCKHGRHCLDHIRRPRKGDAPTQPGRCRDCGIHIVDLPDIDGRHYGDSHELLKTCLDQQNELIRAHYWHVPIDFWSYNQARRLGRRELRTRAANRVRTALSGTNAFAGRGAPYHGDILAYAQHATASCCPRCAAYWHGLLRDTTPAPHQLSHILSLVWAYLDIRLPNLPEDPEPRASVGVITQAMQPDGRHTHDLDRRVAALLVGGNDPAGLLRPINSTLELRDGRGNAGGYLLVRNHTEEQPSKGV